jgi:hypothetical protein
VSISKPTHPKKAASNPGRPPVWWGGGNYIRIKKYRGGTKHKLGRKKGQMVPDRSN